MAGDEIRFGCRNYRKESQRRKYGMLTYGRGYTMEQRSAKSNWTRRLLFDQTCSGQQQIDGDEKLMAADHK
jgi:guanyl-specific ribonuclease Sa